MESEKEGECQCCLLVSGSLSVANEFGVDFFFVTRWKSYWDLGEGHGLCSAWYEWWWGERCEGIKEEKKKCAREDRKKEERKGSKRGRREQSEVEGEGEGKRWKKRSERESWPTLIKLLVCESSNQSEQSRARTKGESEANGQLDPSLKFYRSKYGMVWMNDMDGRRQGIKGTGRGKKWVHRGVWCVRLVDYSMKCMKWKRTNESSMAHSVCTLL